jgi:hypothetical protein
MVPFWFCHFHFRPDPTCCWPPRKSLYANDTIYVIDLRSTYAGFHPKEVNEWLDNSLALS